MRQWSGSIGGEKYVWGMSTVGGGDQHAAPRRSDAIASASVGRGGRAISGRALQLLGWIRMWGRPGSANESASLVQ